MKRTYLRAKIHRATVTGTDVEYEGSITLGRELLEAAEIQPYEKVQVVNCTNGERLETYAIRGEESVVRLNGAAGRLAEPDDTVIILSYGVVDSEDYPTPRIVRVGSKNEVIETETVRAESST